MSRSTPIHSGYTIRNGSGTGTNGNRIDVWVEYYIGSYNITNNTTPFTAYFYTALNSSYSSSTSNYQGLNSTFTVNGSSGYGVSNQSYDFTSSSIVNQIGYYSSNIEHNSDGTKSISISGSFTTSSSWITGGYVSEFTVALPTIPRASSFGTISGNTIGSNMTVNINSNSSSFTHQLWYKLSTAQSWYNLGKGFTTSASFIVSEDLLLQLTNTTSGTLQLCLRTHNGETQIGSDVYKDVTVYVDDGVIPLIGELKLTPEAIKDEQILIKGKNKLTLKISNCVAGKGSEIQRYEFSGPSLSNPSTITSSQNNASMTIDSVASCGELTYTVTVFDKRGRSNSTTKTIQCYDYFAPYFNSFDAYRANEDGSANINGAYLIYKYMPQYADVNNTNSIVVTAHLNGETVDDENIIFNENNEILVDLNGDVDTTYNVYLKIMDAYDGYKSSTILTVFGQTRIFNITSDGTGVAIGKIAEETEMFDCRWQANFAGITINKKTIFDLIYPVGSIYMSVNNIEPSVLFGGTWEPLEDRFLLGASTTYEAGATGGEATHTLTINEMPQHSHTSCYSSGGSTDATWGYSYTDTGGKFTDSTNPQSSGIGATGGGAAHNNMPPYLCVYMWKRIL